MLFAQVDVGTVSQVAYESGKLLQEFPEALGPSVQLSVELLLQMVVTVTILERRSKPFVLRTVGTPCRMCATGPFMAAIKYATLSGGGRRPVVVFRHGL
jgi:hypothetical protein